MGSQASETIWILPFIIVGFPIFFAALWASVLFIISNLGGWAQLAREFSTDQIPVGPAISAKIHLNTLANYQLSEIYVGADDIVLRPFFLFRLFHPALTIRWNAVRSLTPDRVLFDKSVRINFVRPNGAPKALHVIGRDAIERITAQAPPDLAARA